MAEMENYLRIDPDGSVSWIQASRSDLCRYFRRSIGCNWLENVRTVIPDICIVIDEVGKIKDPPQPHNPIASRLYLGFHYGIDDIVGPAIVAAIHLVDGESDWVPLSDVELAKLSLYLGIEIPDIKN